MARNPGGGEASEQGHNSASSPSSKNDRGEDVGPEEVADAGGGPILGEMADESIQSGTIRYDNGCVYDGEFKDGDLMHGTGTFSFMNGYVYEGQFVEGKFHGKGTLTKDGFMYDGEWKNNMKHGKGTLRYENGDIYEGEWKENEKHGKGTTTFSSGDVHVGEWVEGIKHGWGAVKFENGDVYEGQWKDDEKHGKGTAVKFASGDVYEGQWARGVKHGKGTLTQKDGIVYEGGYVNGTKHGRGTMKWPSGNVYEGEWKDGKQHGRGTVKWENGDIYEGEWEDGQKTRGTMTWAGGETWTGRFSHNGNATGTPPLSSAETLALDPPCEPPIERKLRSQKSQQRRLQNSTRDEKTCEHCGVDDGRYKLRMCSGCGLALYCSAACQRAASGSHRRICDITAELPSRDAERLRLEYDKENMVDLDAGLRYAKKYMDNLKHLEINLEKMSQGDNSVEFSAKQLSSLLRSKRGALDSAFWFSNYYIQAHEHDEGRPIMALGSIWSELHDLKQLRLDYMKFSDVRPICDIIDKQKNTLMVLCLPYLDIGWHRAKCRRAFAQAVNACKRLVRLELQGCLLMDSDLKIMLSDLPNLRNLDLNRDTDDNHEFTDNTCGLIARKCPGLQELDLDGHAQISVRGIRKIFEGCIHLKSFHTTTRKLSLSDIQSLLGIAPQLQYLSLADKIDVSRDELSQVVEATGGRTVLCLSIDDGLFDGLFEPDSVSAETKEKYESQTDALSEIWSRHRDPEVASEWAGTLEE